MSTDEPVANAVHAHALTLELAWLEAHIEIWFEHYFMQVEESERRPLPPPPDLPQESALAQLIESAQLGRDERLLLVLALAPHLRPEVLDLFFVRNKNFDRGYTEFGGWHGKQHGGFLPTGETAMFLTGGNDLSRRIELLELFDATHPFARLGILRLESESANEPQLSGALQLSAEALQRLCTGVAHKPDYSIQFPAKLIETDLGWEDLVLSPEVMDQIDGIRAWLEHGETILNDWGLRRSLKPGYRCLFHGPPGTGKTLTASLIGKSVNADVYRVDLSMIVSKYIGETEKNLARVFDQAQSRNWILFFDEADALFGKRTAASSSNDRHANQEVAYLLQRVEDFPGVVILATNLRANLDEAFSRRFQAIVYFPMPDAAERHRLWLGMMNGGARFAQDVNVEELSERYELSGGAISNVLRAAAIEAIRAGRNQIAAADLQRGLSRELRKEGRTVRG